MTERVGIVVSVECSRWDRALADAESLSRKAASAALAAARRDGAELPPRAELSLVLADDALVRALNRRFRKKDRPTNVLAFPAHVRTWRPRPGWRSPPQPLGDVIVAFETSLGESTAQHKPLAHHLAHLVVHGTLHLIGYDHEAAEAATHMERLEITVLAGLGIPDPYADLPDRYGTKVARHG